MEKKGGQNDKQRDENLNEEMEKKGGETIQKDKQKEGRNVGWTIRNRVRGEKSKDASTDKEKMKGKNRLGNNSTKLLNN